MGRTAFVSGADRRLGLALAEALLKRRYCVFAGHLHAVSQELKALQYAYGERLKLLRLDAQATLTPAESAEAILQLAEQKLSAADAGECEYMDDAGQPLSW